MLRRLHSGGCICVFVRACSSVTPPSQPPASQEGSSVEEVKEQPNALARVKRLPLVLIEEVPLPQRVLTDLELVMMAWSEEQAKQFFVMMQVIRLFLCIGISIILYVFYRSRIGSENHVRGADYVPQDMRIGTVVYLDFLEDGMGVGRVVIGLLNEKCPLYCEYFHRRCTANGGDGPSFKGLKMKALIRSHCGVFGDGMEMTHEVPGFCPRYLPTEYTPGGMFRGSLTSLAYDTNKESPNFSINVSGADYSPQVFGIVIGGFDVIQRMNHKGANFGNNPKNEYIVDNCGELCTLDKSHIVPMPWKLYETVSKGYDEEKYGEKADKSLLYSPVPVDGVPATEVLTPDGKSSKPFWKIW